MTNWHIGYVTLLVTDYDEAEAQYRSVLGFELIEDTPMADGKRWVLVVPKLWRDPSAGLFKGRYIRPGARRFLTEAGSREISTPAAISSRTV
jgi:catechol 2,3-dioxygenase-like lactoylglutathione lyase family enzyme